MKPYGPSGATTQWDTYADQLRQQLPAAPEPVLDSYVQWAPWVAIVLGAIGVFFLVLAGIIGTVAAPFLVAFGGSEGLNTAGGLLFAVVFGLVRNALVLVGGILMLRRSRMGWWLLAIGLVVGLLGSLLHIAIGGIIIALLVGYVHLQVKPRYA